jgi:hypothetical protein
LSPPRLTRTCDVDSSALCTDVNCIRRQSCSRILLAKRRMTAHDRKSYRGRRFAWGVDYEMALETAGGMRLIY